MYRLTKENWDKKYKCSPSFFESTYSRNISPPLPISPPPDHPTLPPLPLFLPTVSLVSLPLPVRSLAAAAYSLSV